LIRTEFSEAKSTEDIGKNRGYSSYTYVTKITFGNITFILNYIYLMAMILYWTFYIFIVSLKKGRSSSVSLSLSLSMPLRLCLSAPLSVCQLIRYSKTCDSYQYFLHRSVLLTRKLINQCFIETRLRSRL